MPLSSASNKTTDFYQADETWWQAAFAGGSGKDFLGEVELDKSRYTVQQQRQVEAMTEKLNWIDQQPWKPEEKDAAKKQVQWTYATAVGLSNRHRHTCGQ